MFLIDAVDGPGLRITEMRDGRDGRDGDGAVDDDGRSEHER